VSAPSGANLPDELAMRLTQTYCAGPDTRAEVDALPGLTVLEFGTPWCGYCQIAQPMLARAFEPLPPIRHLKIEDGKGRPLGRSFGVKLWPTVVLLQDGQEIARLVRPSNVGAIAAMLAPRSGDATQTLTLTP
jgi:thioredoxin 1